MRDETIRINLAVLQALAKIYKTTAQYIERGPEGSGANQPLLTSNARLRDKQGDDNHILYIPRIPTKARASFLETFNGNSDFNDFELSLIQNPSPELRKDGSIEIEIDGDSMEPTLLSGWFVACTPVDPGDYKYMPSGVYAVVFGNYFVVKRIKNNDLGPEGTLTLHSDNPRAGTITIDGDDLRSVWRVVRVTEGKIL